MSVHPYKSRSDPASGKLAGTYTETSISHTAVIKYPFLATLPGIKIETPKHEPTSSDLSTLDSTLEGKDSFRLTLNQTHPHANKKSDKLIYIGKLQNKK